MRQYSANAGHFMQKWVIGHIWPEIDIQKAKTSDTVKRLYRGTILLTHAALQAVAKFNCLGAIVSPIRPRGNSG
jgi:hypothetical protein